MRITILALLMLSLVAGTPFARETPEKPEVTGDEELVQKTGAFAGTWVHPDADVSQYSKLYLWNSVFQFREGGDTSATTMEMSRGGSGPFEIREEDQERFKKVVGDAVVAELGRSKLFEITDEVGPDTLLVRGAVLDIISWVPSNVERFSNVHLAGVGEATIFFELIDSETGVMMARVGERRTIQPRGQMHRVSSAPANSNTIWMDVERWARDEAQELRKALEKAKKKAGK